MSSRRGSQIKAHHGAGDSLENPFEADIYVGTIEPIGSDEVGSTSVSVVSSNIDVSTQQQSPQTVVYSEALNMEPPMPKISNITGNFAGSRDQINGRLTQSPQNSQGFVSSTGDRFSARNKSASREGEQAESTAAYPITDDIMTQCLTEAKKRKQEEESEDADISFLKSLVPDMKKMNDRQRNRFKRNVLAVIDDILYST